MILAAGLTPAWQQIVVLDSLRVGEVNRAREVHWCAAGKVLNVGIALAHLGASSITLSPVGGESGATIQREFKASGYNARWIETAAATRVCTTLLDSATLTTTELVENSAPMTSDELSAFVAAYTAEAAQAEVVVLSGSLPQGTPADFYRRLLEQTPGRAVLDVRGPELLAALECRPFLVKPNREELARTFGKPLSSDADLLDAMRTLNARGAEWVVITHGAKTVWMTSATKTYSLPPPTARIVNPIGCGDSMAAGIAWGTSRGLDVPEAVRLGMAAAAANLEQLLPARFDASRIEPLAASISVSGT